MFTYPRTHGSAASLIVLSRPIHSIKIADIRHPTGTDRTIIDAIPDVCSFGNVKPPTPFSSLGIKVAEKPNEISITIWKDAAVAAAKICGSALFRLFGSYVLSDRQLVITSRNASSGFCSSVSSNL